MVPGDGGSENFTRSTHEEEVWSNMGSAKRAVESAVRAPAIDLKFSGLVLLLKNSGGRDV